eukprot:COSAG05_NODE_23528_length_257_cov_0.924051_1_plen_26_part_10
MWSARKARTEAYAYAVATVCFYIIGN